MFGLDKKDEPKADETLDSQNSSTVVAPVSDDDTVNVTVNPSADTTQSGSPTVNNQGTVSMPEPEINLPNVESEEVSEVAVESTAPELTTTPVVSSPQEPESEPEPQTNIESRDNDNVAEDYNLPEGADFQEVEDEKSDAETTASPSVPTGTNNELQELKATTLKDLAPIVGHLDLEPSEKLKTIMEMYDSTKDQALLKEAHEAAISLPDDTARAKALLDLVHKIDELV